MLPTSPVPRAFFWQRQSRTGKGTAKEAPERLGLATKRAWVVLANAGRLPVLRGAVRLDVLVPAAVRLGDHLVELGAVGVKVGMIGR